MVHFQARSTASYFSETANLFACPERLLLCRAEMEKAQVDKPCVISNHSVQAATSAKLDSAIGYLSLQLDLIADLNLSYQTNLCSIFVS